MKTNIIVTLQVEAQHYWTAAKDLIPQVGFLSHAHRHIFFIEVHKTVTHADRDLEIIQFKRELQNYFHRNYFDSDLNMCDFKHRSCEMLAQDLLEAYDLDFAKVTEDNENGASVLKEVSEPYKKIIVVLGKVCSGKDTFAANHIFHKQIDIGSIVRKLMKSEQRIHNKSLDTDLIKHLHHTLYNHSTYNHIITGIRQMSILRYLAQEFSKDIQLIYLDIPEVELKRRYITRAAEKDNQLSFEETLKRDAELGFVEIETFINENKSLFTIIKSN